MVEAYTNFKTGLRPGHHLYGVLELMETHKVEVIIPKHEKFPILNTIGNWLEIEFLDQQIRALFMLHKFDVIYAPYAAANTKLLILLKFLRLIKKPIIILVHDNLFGKPSRNKLKFLVAKKLILTYDAILFLSKKLRSDLLAAYDIDNGHAAKHFFISNWGADLHYFKKYHKNIEPDQEHFLISAGHSGRDFDLLIAVAKRINRRFKIYCRPKSYPKSPSIPKNVEILSGKFPFEKICKDYADALVILIPLRADPEGTVGMTSLLDAIAMGKPVIMTRNKNIDIDLDREGIGITVAENDVEGWVSAISMLLNDLDRVKEMGKNSLRLAREKFNIHILADDLAQVLQSITERI
jgi:glycosyltransferase involved in cell wall biosynthesis